LSADDILYLNTQGVSQPVIAALLQNKGTGAPAPVAAPSTPAPPMAPSQPMATVPAPSAPVVSPYPGEPAPAPTPMPEASGPPPGSDINLAYFQSQLAPYGNWVDIPGQGPCWVPSVQASVPGWRPYFNQGHWIYTDDGWSWQSDYPWGQYVFHYGRWLRDPQLGWAWVPGYHWGPGWVSWRQAEGEGYCGWAPLPPGAVYDPGVGLMWDGRLAVDADFGLGPDMYVFIPFDDFWAHDYVGFRAPFGRVPFLFRVSFAANHYGFVGGHFVFEGIGRDRMAAFTHHDIRVEHLEIRDAHIAHAVEFEHGRAAEFHGGDIHGVAPHGGDFHGGDGRDHDHGF
jgi:hypothetical protein